MPVNMPSPPPGKHEGQQQNGLNIREDSHIDFSSTIIDLTFEREGVYRPDIWETSKKIHMHTYIHILFVEADWVKIV